MKVSVIIPVYNVELYLEECLNSILNQNFDSYEVIAINDGSTDNSLDILKKYSQNYSNLVIIDKSNVGVGDCRNKGLEIAKGEYIYFLDSDDYVDKNLLNKVYNIAKKGNYDMVSWGFYFINQDGKIIGEQALKTTEAKSKILNDWPVVWNKLFKKDVIIKSGVLFPISLWHQDLATIPFYILEASRCIYLNEKLHYYRVIRKGNITHSFGKKSYDIFKVLTILYDSIDKYSKYKSELEFLIYYHGKANIRKWKNMKIDNGQLKEITGDMINYLNKLEVNTFTNKIKYYSIILTKIPSRLKRYINTVRLKMH